MMEQRTASRLIRPVKGWSEDLPDPKKEQMIYPRLIWVNKINDVWMEIPRYVNHGWGWLWFCAFIMLAAFIYLFLPYLRPGFFSNTPPAMALILIIMHFFIFSFAFYDFKVVLFEPRGAPVRFNRKRQKVYVYEYAKSIWFWKRWPVVIKVFDWADIQGERVLMSGHADWGHRVYCAVCKPGTYEVVDRFILTWTVGDIRDAYSLWSHCCQYMQGKAVSDKPLLTTPPPSWTPFNTVHWPEALDKESTTVPEQN